MKWYEWHWIRVCLFVSPPTPTHLLKFKLMFTHVFKYFLQMPSRMSDLSATCQVRALLIKVFMNTFFFPLNNHFYNSGFKSLDQYCK